MAKNIARSVSSHLEDHVTLEVECVDRLYLNAYVGKLQYDGGVVQFFRHHRGHPFASSALMDPMTKGFVRRIETFTEDEGIPLISFEKGQRKDDVLLKHLAAFGGDEGVLFVGKAQEKVPAFRTQKRRNPETGATYPWLYRTQVMVNQYYFYILDEGFGPFFIKFSSYFPYNAKFCLNGHEYAKRQLKKEGIRFQALDNGVLSCDDPRRLQEICDGLSPEKIDAVFRKWLRRLPHPSGQRSTHLRPPDHPYHPRSFPYPCHHLGRRPLPSYRLQELVDEAVPQGGQGPSHRVHLQQFPRLWNSQAARSSSRSPEDRL